MEDWKALAARQQGMLARRQLNRLGFDSDRVRNQLAAGRWSERTPTVVSVTTGPLSWEQRLWLAVLHAGPGALVGGLSAAAVHGLRHWERPTITVLVDDERAFDPVAGVDFFRTRRDRVALRQPALAMPVCRLEPAVLLFAGYERHRRTAHGVLAAVVQQRLTTPERLGEWLATMRPLRRAREFRATLLDLAGGAQSVAEIDVRRLCDRFGLVRPSRQVPRVDRSGRPRWTDCEWRLRTGRTLVLEVDGAFHLDVTHQSRDVRRARRLTTLDRVVLRCTSFELRHEPHEVAADLIALGVPRRVPLDAS
ncbi:hypothetical protein [Nocardioides donggukensis]|uniref:DUF559 domain-containing protein n=1 Tax=Nocardioides donggukensis TaxID=2774019 RepID=A0A927K1P6_9ACTN|nr:hypothetical protein [Nocardioides donggukensis]MBD8868539.1 hypothetical protein [Nocardioides donggukensis]